MDRMIQDIRRILRGNQPVYLASRALVTSSFVLGVLGIGMGSLQILGIYRASLHPIIMVNIAIPGLIVGVATLLIPAYILTPPWIFMIPALTLSPAILAVSIIYIATWEHDLLLYIGIMISIISISVTASSLYMLGRSRARGFQRVMNYLFTASLAVISAHALTLPLGFLGLTPYYPSNRYWVLAPTIPMIFSVMMRTDIYMRRWYSEKSSRVAIIVSTTALISGLSATMSIYTGWIYAQLFSDILMAFSIYLSAILMLPISRGWAHIRVYELLVRVALIWGLIISTIAIMIDLEPSLKFSAYLSEDLVLHSIALGFAGNIFLAYSRYLLPYSPFTAMARAVDLYVALLANTAIASRVLHPILRYFAEPFLGIAAGLLTLILLGIITARIIKEGL